MFYFLPLNRRQTVALLEQRLSSERNKLNRETVASLQSFEILQEKREQLERDELQLVNLFQVVLFVVSI